MVTEKLEKSFWDFLQAVAPAVAQWLSIEDNELLMFMEPDQRKDVITKFDILGEQIRTIAVHFPYNLLDDDKPSEG